MAAKRKVDNLMALAVLSTVIQRPMHRYEIASLMRARGKDQDMDVKWGSLYTVVQNLAKHGFLEVVGTSRQGARPERTVYQITEAGRQEMLDWTRELLSAPEPEHPKFAAGLSVQMILSPEEVIALLRRSRSPHVVPRSPGISRKFPACSWSRMSSPLRWSKRRRPGSARCWRS
jgi:DNA-binding PadR family transcriptional regulator